MGVGPSIWAALLYYVPVATFLRRPPKQAILENIGIDALGCWHSKLLNWMFIC